jgi:hypothetical protein
MELPARRVVTREAAIMHELVHVLFPNANRFLAEGLAIFLQAQIGGNPAFPNFGRPLHAVAREVLNELVPEHASEHLDAVSIAALDDIATPAPLTLQVNANVYGEEPRGQGRIYPLVGSFIQYLIETRNMERFQTIYSQTPLVPGEQGAWPANRWLSVYDCSLSDVEREWKTMISLALRGSVASAAYQGLN